MTPHFLRLIFLCSLASIAVYLSLYLTLSEPRSNFVQQLSGGKATGPSAEIVTTLVWALTTGWALAYSIKFLFPRNFRVLVHGILACGALLVTGQMVSEGLNGNSIVAADAVFTAIIGFFVAAISLVQLALFFHLVKVLVWIFRKEWLRYRYYRRQGISIFQSCCKIRNLYAQILRRDDQRGISGAWRRFKSAGRNPKQTV